MTAPRLIGLAGLKGAGKDTAAEWLRGQGGQLWHIVRDWKTHYNRSSEQHISEQGVLFHPSDTLILNTGSLAQLHAQLASALKAAQ